MLCLKWVGNIAAIYKKRGFKVKWILALLGSLCMQQVFAASCIQATVAKGLVSCVGGFGNVDINLEVIPIRYTQNPNSSGTCPYGDSSTQYYTSLTFLMPTGVKRDFFQAPGQGGGTITIEEKNGIYFIASRDLSQPHYVAEGDGVYSVVYPGKVVETVSPVQIPYKKFSTVNVDIKFRSGYFNSGTATIRFDCRTNN